MRKHNSETSNFKTSDSALKSVSDMAFINSINIDSGYDENYYIEKHLHPGCEMLRIKYYRKNRPFYIFMRQCYCDRYSNVEESEIDFRNPDDMMEDGVFIHNDKNCYYSYTELQQKRNRKYRIIYVHGFFCYCTNTEYLSYIR